MGGRMGASRGAVLGWLVILSVAVAGGGNRVNVRGMAMGRSAVAASRGLDAVGINPANLALSGNDVLSFTVLPVSAYLSSDFLTYELFSKYLKTRRALIDLPDPDKQVILSSFDGPTGSGNAEFDARLVGLTLRIDSTSAVAFTVDYSFTGAASIPREYARLLLYGNTPGSAFSIDAISIQAFWARSLSLSFGTRLPTPSFLSWLAGGFGAKVIQGYGYYEITNATAALHTANDGGLTGVASWQARWTDANAFGDPVNSLFQKPAGYGLGVDFGVSGGVGDLLTFGISLTDIGWVKWTSDVEVLSSDSLFTASRPDAFKNINSLTNVAGIDKQKGEAFSSSLPGLLRIGVAARVDGRSERDEAHGRLLIAAEFSEGVRPDSPLAEKQRLALGVEYRPIQWLPVRSGVSIGGSGTHVAFGFGLNFRWFDLDLGTEDIVWAFSGRRFSTGSLGMAMRFRNTD